MTSDMQISFRYRSHDYTYGPYTYSDALVVARMMNNHEDYSNVRMFSTSPHGLQ